MTLTDRIALLHEHPAKIVLVCTGAGAGCQNLLSQVPGASKTILESIFPYSQQSLVDFLGFEPSSYASEDTALRMSARAWRRGIELAVRQKTSTDGVLGVAITAAIATDRVLRGEHRAFIAVRSSKGFFCGNILFSKKPDGHSVLGREKEGQFCDLLTLNAIFNVVGIKPLDIQESSVTLRYWGQKDFPDGLIETTCLDKDKHVLFPGSFNPLHFGHEFMAQKAGLYLGKEVVYLINTTHPDKGHLSDSDIFDRTKQFAYLSKVCVTSGLDLFIDKARCFKGFTFIIGSDTLERILDEKYSVSVESVLSTFFDCEVNFLVFDRYVDGRLSNLDGLKSNIPEIYRDMFKNIPLIARISSTEVRRSLS